MLGRFDTILKIDGDRDDYFEIAQLINKLSSSGTRSSEPVHILNEAAAALKDADLILYSDKHIETSVGAALIVPGANESIKFNPKNNKLKVCLSQGDEGDALNNLDCVYRYITRKMKFSHHDEIQ